MEIPASILWAALSLTIVLMLSIFFVSYLFQLKLLDQIANPQKVKDALNVILNDEPKRQAHIWITATLDVAFPLSYGFLFAASAIQFFPGYGLYLAIPAVMATVTDLFEGGIQLLALTRTADFTKLKKVVTPLKFALSFIGLIIALIGLIQ